MAITPARPYPYPRPIPPPPIPNELGDPISCYKCHSPSIPLPTSTSSEVYAAESYYRQVLTSTWRTQIDTIEAQQLANTLEEKGFLLRWVELLLEQATVQDPVNLKAKDVLDQSRDGFKELVTQFTASDKMEARMERVLKRTMESVLIRMMSLGYGSHCFHDLLRTSPHATVPTYSPPAPSSPHCSATAFSASFLRSLAAGHLPSFAKRLRTQLRLTPDDLGTILLEVYAPWRALLVEACKREYHKTMYDVQLMMVGGFSIKLLELAWRELRIDRTRARTVEVEKKEGFKRVVRWCEAGGVRIALWEKGEKERMEKERKREVEEAVKVAQELREKEVKEKEERKKRERTERRRKRDQDRLEEILGRLGAIEKERRALLEESLGLETERQALENKLQGGHHSQSSPAPSTPRPASPTSSSIAEVAPTTSVPVESVATPAAAPDSPASLAPAVDRSAIPPTAASTTPPPAVVTPSPASIPAPAPVATNQSSPSPSPARVQALALVSAVLARVESLPSPLASASSGATSASGGGKKKTGASTAAPTPSKKHEPLNPRLRTTAAATSAKADVEEKARKLKQKQQDEEAASKAKLEEGKGKVGGNSTNADEETLASASSASPSTHVNLERVSVPVDAQQPNGSTPAAPQLGEGQDDASVLPGLISVSVDPSLALPPLPAQAPGQVRPSSPDSRAPSPANAATTAPVPPPVTSGDSGFTSRLPPPFSSAEPTPATSSSASRATSPVPVPPSISQSQRSPQPSGQAEGQTWASRLSLAHSRWIPPSGSGTRRTAIRRVNSDGSSSVDLQHHASRVGVVEDWGMGMGADWIGEHEYEQQQHSGMKVGSSRELEEGWRRDERRRMAREDPWSRRAPRVYESQHQQGGKRGRGKGKERVRELECICEELGWDGREDTKVVAARAALAKSSSAGPNGAPGPPQPAPIPSSLATPTSISDQPKLPHICPLDIHTPDPHAPSDYVPPLFISSIVSSNLSACFLSAFHSSLAEINAAQLLQLFQSSAKEGLGQVWMRGGDPQAYVEGRQEEIKAVESVVGEIVCITARKEYHDRVAKLALRTALPKVVREVWKSLRASLPRESRDTQPPCLCLIEAQSWILHEYLNRHPPAPPAAAPATTSSSTTNSAANSSPPPTLLPYSEASTRSLEDIYASLVIKKHALAKFSTPYMQSAPSESKRAQHEQELASMLTAHEKAFDAFHLRATRVNPADFASVKHVIKLLTAQGGAAVWRMATKQMAAIEALEADTFSPLNAWETVVEDVGVRAEEQVFRKENDTLQNKIIFDDVTAPWGSLTGLNTGHPTDPEACIFDLTVATTVRPDLPRPYLARAIARLKIDRPWHNSEILYDASMALALSPPLSHAETAVAYRVRAAAYSKQCRLKEAYQDFRRDTESKASVTATALLRNSLPGARITLPGFLRPPKSRARAGKIVCHPGRCCMPPQTPNDLVSLKPLDKPLLEAFLAAVRLEAHLAYQREVHRVLTESVIGALLFDESDVEDKATIKSSSSFFWFQDLEAYFVHTATKVFPEELRKSMESWLCTDWYQEHMQETLERAAKRLSEEYLYSAEEKQCLCTLHANPETIVRLEAARRIYDALSDKVRRPDAIAEKDRASLRQDIESELAEGKRTGEFWTKGGWDEALDKAADHGFAVLSQVLLAEEKAGKLNWIEQYDGVVKILRHISGVLVYHSIASSPKLTTRRKIGDVDDMAAWVSVALEERDLTAESATLLEDMGDVFYKAEEGERALQCYSEAIAIHRTPHALMQRVRLVKKLAWAEQVEERTDRAQLIVRDASQAIALQPVHPDALAARAEALYQLGYFYDSCSDLFSLHHIAPDHESIYILAHQLDALDPFQRRQSAGPDDTLTLEGAHSPMPPLYNRLRTSLTSVHPFSTSRPTPLVKTSDPAADEPMTNGKKKESPTLSSAPVKMSTAMVTAAEQAAAAIAQRDATTPSAELALYNSALARQQKGSAPPKPTTPLSYYPDPRCACPPIRCSGEVPVVENLDRLDELLLEIFLMSHKIELSERRPLSFASIRDTLLRQYILTPGWEKGNVDSPAQRALMETLSNDLLSSGYENGTARADRGLESWLNATLLAIKSLPIHRGNASSRDCCVCLLSGNMDHVQVVHSVLARKVKQLRDDPITLPRPDIVGLLGYCRTQIKLGTLVARGGIWRSAPKWRFEVEKLANVFEQVFESVVRKFNYKAFEDDYPQIAKLVGGLATFEAAHRLLLHPDPPEPGSTKRPPLAVEDVLGWAAFVSANAPYEGDGDLSKLGDVKTIGLATAKVDEATKLFRDAKYLEAIRAYSIAAIWACDRSGKETPGAERKYLRDEARRTLKSGIYAQLSYLRTLFPSNRQWNSAVADATLAIACSQKAELPAALDLRSTALHGIRHYKYALSDLEDAARLDSIKGRGWEERLAEMRRLIAPNSRITSRFAVRLEEAGPIPLDFQELESAPSACPRPGCSGKECSGEDAHITRAKDAVAHFTNGANSHLAKSTIYHERPRSEADSDDAHPLANYVLCPDPRMACPPHRCSEVAPTEGNIDRLDKLLLELFLVSHAWGCSSQSSLSRRERWVREFILLPPTLEALSSDSPDSPDWMDRMASQHVRSRLDTLSRPHYLVAEGWHSWMTGCLLAFKRLEVPRRTATDPTSVCICGLSSDIDRVQTVVDRSKAMAASAKANGKLPPLPTLDAPLIVSSIREHITTGKIPKNGIWADEAKWTVRIAKLVSAYGTCYDRFYQEAEQGPHTTIFPKLARYLGGVATYAAAQRHIGVTELKATALEDMFGWNAFAIEYADSHLLGDGELADIPAHERAALAQEQDRKAQKSGGQEMLAIRAFTIKSIWLGHLKHPLRDDDGARDDLFCTFAAVAKLRVRLLTTAQLQEAVTDFTSALGYLNSATIRLNRAEALVLLGSYDDLACRDVLEARTVGNFAGRELPAWEASLAQRMKDRGYPQLAEVHAMSTDGAHFTANGANGSVDIVDIPTTSEGGEASLQDVVESAVAAIDQSLATSAIDDFTDSPRADLPDPRLACSPDRHDVGSEPSPGNIDQVDKFLLDIFLVAHEQMLHKLHPGRLAETRELFLQDFIRRRSGWEKTDVETSPVMRKAMREGIKIALGEMFTSSVLAGFGLEAVVHALGHMSSTISSHFESDNMTPCICTLTRSVPVLQKILAELEATLIKLGPSPPPPSTDLAVVQAHCRAQIKSGALSGGIWRSAPVWRKKLGALVAVFDQVFLDVVEHDWEGAEIARRGEYEAVMKQIGGASVWDRALRVRTEMNLGGWKIEDSGAGNGGREVEATSGLMCLVGTSGATKNTDDESPALKRARCLKIKDERIRLGNIELANGEPKRALREFSVASLFVPDDPSVYTLMARARLALNDPSQCHEVIADCTLGLARCSIPPPSLPVTLSEHDKAPVTSTALTINTRIAPLKGKTADSPSDPTAYTRADLLLLRAKALVAIERFGLALYDLEALSSSLRREHTAEADAMIQSIKTWISQEQRGLEELRREAADAALQVHAHCDHCCDRDCSAESGEDEPKESVQ